MKNPLEEVLFDFDRRTSVVRPHDRVAGQLLCHPLRRARYRRVEIELCRWIAPKAANGNESVEVVARQHHPAGCFEEDSTQTFAFDFGQLKIPASSEGELFAVRWEVRAQIYLSRYYAIEVGRLLSVIHDPRPDTPASRMTPLRLRATVWEAVPRLLGVLIGGAPGGVLLNVAPLESGAFWAGVVLWILAAILFGILVQRLVRTRFVKPLAMEATWRVEPGQVARAQVVFPRRARAFERLELSLTGTEVTSMGTAREHTFFARDQRPAPEPCRHFGRRAQRVTVEFQIPPFCPLSFTGQTAEITWELSIYAQRWGLRWAMTRELWVVSHAPPLPVEPDPLDASAVRTSSPSPADQESS